MGWILKCALMSEKTKHFTSCRARAAPAHLAASKQCAWQGTPRTRVPQTAQSSSEDI